MTICHASIIFLEKCATCYCNFGNKNIFKSEINKSIIYYSRDTDYSDNVLFQNNKIIIDGSRTKKINNSNILETPNSTYYSAIVKSLLFTYYSTEIQFEINNISILVNNLLKKEYPNAKIEQVFKQKIPDELSIINSNKLFDNKKNSDIMMNALMNLTLSFHLPNLKFDYTWKCFNGLIRDIFKEKKEFNMLKDLRQDIESNTNLYTNILNFFKNIDHSYIDACFINGMICNNYPKGSTNGLVDFLIDFNDTRVIKVLKDKMKCKKNDLTSINKFQEIETYYANKLKTPCTKDSDIIRIIILKYAYYLRCKFFHAEKLPPNFLIDNMNQQELNRISIPLSIICKDLLENKL